MQKTNLYFPVDRFSFDDTTVKTNDYPFMVAVNDGITSGHMRELCETKKNFVIELYVNPIIDDFEADEALKMWIFESNKITTNKNLDNNTVYKMLPPITTKLVVDGVVFQLNNCRLIGCPADSKKGYKLTLLVNNVEEIN